MIMLLAPIVHTKDDRVSYCSLLVAGLLAIGTTLSNVIHFGYMYWAIRIAKGHTPVSALSRSVCVGAFLLMAALSIFYVLGAVRGVDRGITHDLTDFGNFLDKYKAGEDQQFENFIRFPGMVARTFIPTIPKQKQNVSTAGNDNQIQFELTYYRVEFGFFDVILGIVSLLIFGGAAVLSYRYEGIWRWMGIGSMASILTFGVLYSWLCTNTYLYSQHWLVPCVFLLGAWIKLRFFRSCLGRILVLGTMTCILVGDIYVVGEIYRAITYRLQTE